MAVGSCNTQYWRTGHPSLFSEGYIHIFCTRGREVGLPLSSEPLEFTDLQSIAIVVRVCQNRVSYCCVGSLLTRMIFLPKFSPRSKPIKSLGAFVSPSVISSLYLICPACSHSLMSAKNCGYCDAKSETM